MNKIKNMKECWDWIDYKKDNFVFILIIDTLFFIFCWSTFDSIKNEILRITISAFFPLLALIAWLTWFFFFRIPKHPKNKIGITIALKCEKSENGIQLKSDFIQELKDRLTAEKRYNLLILDERLIERRDINNIKSITKKTRSVLFIYGDHKIRSVQKTEQHFLKIYGLLRHKQVPESIRKKLEQDFNLFLPEKWRIQKENDLLGFELTAKLIRRAVTYMISLVSLAAGKFDFSMQGFESIYKEFSGNNEDIFNKKIRDRLIETYEILIYRTFAIWKANKETESLKDLNVLLNKLIKINSNNYIAHLSSAIYSYVVKNDIETAKKHIDNCRNNHTDDTWRFSEAFLLAVEGDLDGAYKIYKNLVSKNISGQKIIEAEEFINWVISKKNLLQLYYCLGLLNFFIKRDYESAFREFNDFVKSCENYDDHKVHAKKYIKEINEKIN